jgi:hypothetical protein
MLFISLYKNRKSSNNILKPFSIALDSRNNILVHIITFHSYCTTKIPTQCTEKIKRKILLTNKYLPCSNNFTQKGKWTKEKLQVNS